MNYISCKTVELGSIDATCDVSKGGIKRVLVCPKEDIEHIGVANVIAEDDKSTDENKGAYITDICLAANKKFVEYRFRRGTGSFTSTYTTDQTTGSMVVTTEVTLQFSKAENNKRMEFQNLTAHPVVMIIEDMYGKYLVIGDDAPIYLTNTVMQSGTQSTDANSFQLTFTCEDSKFPYFLDGDEYAMDYFDVSKLLLPAKKYTVQLTQDKWADFMSSKPEVTWANNSFRLASSAAEFYATFNLVGGGESFTSQSTYLDTFNSQMTARHFSYYYAVNPNARKEVIPFGFLLTLDSGEDMFVDVVTLGGGGAPYAVKFSFDFNTGGGGMNFNNLTATCWTF